MPDQTGQRESSQASAGSLVISARKPYVRRIAGRPTFPLPLKLRVRSLYIIQQLSSAEIAAQVGLTRKQIQDLAAREGWVAIKQRAKSSLVAKHDARAKAEIAEIHDAFALKTEELGMGVLEKAARRMPDEDENVAKDLQALSQTAKNFIGIARQVRGMDLGARESAGVASVVVFVADLERVEDRKRPEKSANLQPALEAETRQAVTG